MESVTPPQRKVAARRRSVESARKVARAIELRGRGLDYDAIAQELGWRSRSTAWEAVQRGLAEIRTDSAQVLRDVESARLDALQAAHWARAMDGHIPSSRLVVEIIALRAKLFGLFSAQPTTVDAAVDLRAELAQGRRLRANAEQRHAKVAPDPEAPQPEEG